MAIESTNRLEIIYDMLDEANSRLIGEPERKDYITSILLSGAIIMQLAPLIKEFGGTGHQEKLAKILGADPATGKQYPDGIFRSTYNSLKHSGSKHDTSRKNPSDDMQIEINFAEEAKYLLSHAKEYVKNIPAEFFTHNPKRLPDHIIDIL